MRTLLSLTALLAVASGCGSDDTPAPVVDVTAPVEAVVPDTLTVDLDDTAELEAPATAPVDVPAADAPALPPVAPPPAPAPPHDTADEGSHEMDGGHEMEDGHTMEDGTRMDGEHPTDDGHDH